MIHSPSSDRTFKSHFEQENCKIFRFSRERLLLVRWKGQQTTDRIKESCGELIKYLSEERVAPRVCIDSRDLSGNMDALSDWLTNLWIPQLLSAGIVELALLGSENLFSTPPLGFKLGSLRYGPTAQVFEVIRA